VGRGKKGLRRFTPFGGRMSLPNPRFLNSAGLSRTEKSAGQAGTSDQRGGPRAASLGTVSRDATARLSSARHDVTTGERPTGLELCTVASSGKALCGSSAVHTRRTPHSACDGAGSIRGIAACGSGSATCPSLPATARCGRTSAVNASQSDAQSGPAQIRATPSSATRSTAARNTGPLVAPSRGAVNARDRSSYRSRGPCHVATRVGACPRVGGASLVVRADYKS
jgi:hypothetical protein